MKWLTKLRRRKEQSHEHVWGDGQWIYYASADSWPDFEARCMVEGCTWSSNWTHPLGATCELPKATWKSSQIDRAMADAAQAHRVVVIEPESQVA